MPLDWLYLVLTGLLGVLAGLVALRGRRALREMGRMLRNLESGRPVRRLLGLYPGAPGHLVEIYNEVVPRLEARLERLNSDRNLLQIVLEGMAEGVLAVDGRRRILFVNRSALELFAMGSPGIGRLLAEVVRSPELQQVVELTFASESPRQEEIQLPGPRPMQKLSGARILAVRGRRLEGGAGAVLVFHDVTDLRRLERMRQDFVANASHELKTPLAAIQAFTETLIDGAIEDETVNRDFLRRIEEQTARLNALILDMLSLARLDGGRETFQHRPLVASHALRACYDNHLGRALASGLRLTLHLGNLDDATRIVADEEAMRQILDNLIDNAMKYTPEGGRVNLNAKATAAQVVIEVSDTGMGIPRDELPRIFERFYRVEKGRSRAKGGTGLGLAIVRHLVQALGGSISVESRVNSGSLFRVELPRYRLPRSAAGSESAEATSVAPGEGEKKDDLDTPNLHIGLIE